MASTHMVFLVPGFFGFTRIRGISYFHEVGDTIEHELRALGLDARVIECPTVPTGSIPRRANRLARHVVESGGLEADVLHFVGHSTGGLDVRLLLSPDVHAAAESVERRIVARTRTAITVATPHHGAPLASFFATIQGRHLLRWLAKLATSGGGRLSIVGLARVVALAAWADDLVGRRGTLFGRLTTMGLGAVSIDRDDPMWAFIRDVADDQGVIHQLTAEALELFNALARDGDGIRYRCVVTAAPPPPFEYRVDDILAPDRALLAALFVGIHTLNRWTHGQYPYPVPDAEVLARLRGDLGFDVDDQSSDGIVPTFSQIHGELITAVRGDHLDVVGQYQREGEPLSDWLPSGSGFDLEDFEILWRHVAATIVRDVDEHGA